MTKKQGVPTNAPLVSAENVAAVETRTKTTVPAIVASTVEIGKATLQSAQLSVPFVSEPLNDGNYDGEQCLRCDLGLLTREQNRKLRAIRRGYIVQDRRLMNGGEVKSMADAVRALIDSIQI